MVMLDEGTVVAARYCDVFRVGTRMADAPCDSKVCGNCSDWRC